MPYRADVPEPDLSPSMISKYLPNLARLVGSVGRGEEI